MTPVSFTITQSVTATARTIRITRRITRVCGQDASTAVFAAARATSLVFACSTIFGFASCRVSELFSTPFNGQARPPLLRRPQIPRRHLLLPVAVEAPRGARPAPKSIPSIHRSRREVAVLRGDDPDYARCATLLRLLAASFRPRPALPGVRDYQPRATFAAGEPAYLPAPRFPLCLLTSRECRQARPIQRAHRMRLNTLDLNEFRFRSGEPYFKLLIGLERGQFITFTVKSRSVLYATISSFEFRVSRSRLDKAIVTLPVVSTIVMKLETRNSKLETPNRLFFLRSQFFQNRKIFERSDIARNRAARSNLAQ